MSKPKRRIQCPCIKATSVGRSGKRSDEQAMDEDRCSLTVTRRAQIGVTRRGWKPVSRRKSVGTPRPTWSPGIFCRQRYARGWSKWSTHPQGSKHRCLHLGKKASPQQWRQIFRLGDVVGRFLILLRPPCLGLVDLLQTPEAFGDLLLGFGVGTFVRCNLKPDQRPKPTGRDISWEDTNQSDQFFAEVRCWSQTRSETSSAVFGALPPAKAPPGIIAVFMTSPFHLWISA